MAFGIRDQVTEALADLRASHAAQSRAIDALEAALHAGLQQGLNALPEPSVPTSEHRRAHRPGVPAKIDSDPELQAFIAARIDRLTFVQIAAEVAETFPPARHVGKTAIHDWWRRTRKDHRRTPPDHPG